MGSISGWKGPLEKRKATHSSILAWRFPWTQEPGGLQSMWSQTFEHNWATNTEKAMAPHSSTLAWKIPWTEVPGRLQSMGSGRVWPGLSNFTFTFHFYALEKEMATHSSVLAWRIPGMGSHRVGHDWSDLAAAAEQLTHTHSFRNNATALFFAIFASLWWS